MPYDPRLAEAYRHSIMTAVELGDWEGVEQALDAAMGDPYVQDVVVTGLMLDMAEPPVVEDGTLWPAFIVGGCIVFYLIVVAVRAYWG